MEELLKGFTGLTWQAGVMFLIGGLLIFLAISTPLPKSLVLPVTSSHASSKPNDSTISV